MASSDHLGTAALRPRQLIGRERESTEVKETLLATSVTTLTGPGGVGKTALAVNLAAACAADFSGGVVVWLGSLRSAELVVAEVAAQTGLPKSGGDSLEDALVRGLSERDVLLLLDNCEHVRAAVADLVDVLHETWAALEAAVDAGLVRHLGVSNFSVKKLSELLPHCRIKPEVNQVELHPLLQQRELVAYCTSQGLHVTAYAPLGSGDRPAFVKAPDAPVLLDNPVIRAIAVAHDRTSAQVLIAWHVRCGISAVPKTVNPARLRENLQAAELELTPAELERIAALDKGYRMIAGAFWVLPGTSWTLQTIWDEP